MADISLDFTNINLVAKYGTWVKVQVAFYDFIFQESINMCPEHFREKAMQEMCDGGFADGEDIYEASVRQIEGMFNTPGKAWEAFVKQNSKD